MTLDQSNAPLTKIAKDVPKHVPAKPAGLSVQRLQAIRFAEQALTMTTLYVYAWSHPPAHPNRSELFHSLPGQMKVKKGADCAQAYASWCHWAGQTGFTDTDWTDTLLKRGKPVSVENAKPSDAAVWGPGTGTHVAMLVERISPTDWWTIGFGHQGAPNRVKLSDMSAWMVKHGHPGLRCLRFTP